MLNARYDHDRIIYALYRLSLSKPTSNESSKSTSNASKSMSTTSPGVSTRNGRK